ncbi:MAG: hypothetical protein ACRC78_01495 [Planktothrix sp.]
MTSLPLVAENFARPSAAQTVSVPFTPILNVYADDPNNQWLIDVAIDDGTNDCLLRRFLVKYNSSGALLTFEVYDLPSLSTTVAYDSTSLVTATTAPLALQAITDENLANRRSYDLDVIYAARGIPRT